MSSKVKTLNIKTRVMLALLLPLLGIAGISGYVLTVKVQARSDMAQVQELAGLATRASGLVHELQKERGASAVYLGSDGAEMADAMTTQRSVVDTAHEELDELLASFEPERFGAEFAGQLARSQAALDQLAGTRQGISALTIPDSEAIAYFSNTVSSLLEVVSGVALVSKDPGVSNVISSYVGFLWSKEKAGQERAKGAAGISGGGFDLSSYLGFAQVVAEQGADIRTFESYASADILQYRDATLVGRSVDEVERIRALVLEAGPGGHVAGVEGAYWYEVTTARIDLLKKIEDRIADELRDGAADVYGSASLTLYVMGAIVALLLATTALLGLVSVRAIAGPLVAMTSAMRQLAGGDKSVEIPATDRRDEVGQMAQAVLVFKENMIKAEELAAKEAEAQKQREARARASESLTGDFDKSVSSTLKTVDSAATELQSTAESMSATAEETNRQSSAVAAASEQASTNVQTVAAAAEELSSSIAEISRQVSQSAAIAGKAVADAERTDVQVQGLAEAAQKIGDVVRLINDIASQTNLLALNATIEAARAGEAGKGFAVVAAEVKNLANETAKATEEITAQIAGVQGATKEAVTAIQVIGQTIGQINEIATTIASAVEEQGAATQEIARNVQQASAGTAEVSSNIAGVTQAATETGAAASQVLGASGELSREAEALRAQVERFLAGVRAA